MDQRFSKESRLLNKADFQRVFDNAPFRASHPNLLILAAPSSHQQPRLGLVVGKKNTKKAVARNRIKRLIRESFRCHKQQLPAIDLVCISRKGLADLDNPAMFQLLEQQWKRLIKKASKLSTKTIHK
ncbi:ribonuclease P protein component [Spartinivicinus poritis]|uniref:Ribonuclease P protein component n=1 Tax=Spartinivicinus poritis TaxID=2994640 RepID=A0ABT5UBI8_9GAMM|nr:ribonuclease P protein component [Spartinivicinus sp. A2-2]MDE1463748.1 ribonuclease P protein component [Spartinivicinus sp. A2-2]